MEENGHVMSALEIENESEWISSLLQEEEKPLPLGTAAPVSAALLAEVDVMDNLHSEMDDVLAEAGSLLAEVDSYSAISSRSEGKKLVIPLEESNVKQQKVM